MSGMLQNERVLHYGSSRPPRRRTRGYPWSSDELKVPRGLGPTRRVAHETRSSYWGSLWKHSTKVAVNIGELTKGKEPTTLSLSLTRPVPSSKDTVSTGTGGGGDTGPVSSWTVIGVCSGESDGMGWTGQVWVPQRNVGVTRRLFRESK